jgi:hypothetical protein
VVDKSSLTKSCWVRIKVVCRNIKLIGSVSNVYINRQSCHIRWEVKGSAGKAFVPPASGGGEISVGVVQQARETKRSTLKKDHGDGGEGPRDDDNGKPKDLAGGGGV